MKRFIFIFFVLFTFSCAKKPLYVEVEGQLVSTSDNIYSGEYALEGTGDYYNWTGLEFYEPVTNLDVGVKYTYHYEIVYDILYKNPEKKEDIIKHLGYRVRIKGELRIPDKSYLHTNYFRATDYRPEFWRVRTNMSWHIIDSEVIKILD